MAARATNLGVIYLNNYQDIETAIPLLMGAYNLLKEMDSPDVNVPESYLNAILAQIGDERFMQIIQSIQPNP